jgi:hypothetical protein
MTVITMIALVTMPAYWLVPSPSGAESKAHYRCPIHDRSRRVDDRDWLIYHWRRNLLIYYFGLRILVHHLPLRVLVGDIGLRHRIHRRLRNNNRCWLTYYSLWPSQRD